MVCVSLSFLQFRGFAWTYFENFNVLVFALHCFALVNMSLNCVRAHPVGGMNRDVGQR